MADAISCSSFVACFKDPIMNEMKYLFNLRTNMRNLRKAADGLKRTKNEVEGRIKSETEARDDEVPTERVQMWLEKVESAEREVTKIEGDHDRLKVIMTDCFGGCPLNCWSGYKISKRAVNALEEVKELEKEKKEEMDAVTEKVVPAWRPKHDSALPLPATDILLKNAIQFLKDETVGVIGIWGMGGVGKTTLLKRINNHPEVESAGYRVIWAVVSQEFNPYKLQRDIAKSVGLHLEEQDATTELQAERLRHFLKDQKLLLLLDDIWKEFDVEELGIPSLGSSDSKVPHSKVVFTTRTNMVCNGMSAIHHQVRHMKINVECLKPEEAWKLFFNKIGETVQNIIKSDVRVRGHAETVAKRCAGLPLALVVIARAMSSNETLDEWKDAVNSVNDLPDLLDEKTDQLYLVLKVSYDRLNDQMRKCFLCCALWPEDHNISKDELIRCWLGMGDAGAKSLYDESMSMDEDTKLWRASRAQEDRDRAHFSHISPRTELESFVRVIIDAGDQASDQAREQSKILLSGLCRSKVPQELSTDQWGGRKLGLRSKVAGKFQRSKLSVGLQSGRKLSLNFRPLSGPVDRPDCHFRPALCCESCSIQNSIKTIVNICFRSNLVRRLVR